MRKLTLRSLLLPITVAILAACSGGGSGTQNALSGVAAVGAPLSGATVTLTDSLGAQKTTTADDQGNFAFNDLSGMVAPYQIMAVMSLGERTVSHYSLVASVSGAQTANVTQLTSAMAALLNTNAGVLTSLTNEQLAALTPGK